MSFPPVMNSSRTEDATCRYDGRTKYATCRYSFRTGCVMRPYSQHPADGTGRYDGRTADIMLRYGVHPSNEGLTRVFLRRRGSGPIRYKA